MPRSYRVCWTMTAERDLEAIIEYIARESKDTARRILKKLRDAAGTLSSRPHRGRVVPELSEQGITSYHELIVPPWRILYRIRERYVHVLAVLDSRRNLEDILLERLTRQ